MPDRLHDLANVVTSGTSSTEDTLSTELVDEMQGLFGKHLGYRTTHAKGLLVKGTFTPTKEAGTLSIASHYNKGSTPVIARFSVGGGIPRISDVDDGATPKGLAVRSLVDEHVHTDLVSHTFDGFATRTGNEFLRVFRALETTEAALDIAQATGGDTIKETADFRSAAGAFQAFLARHPSAATFVTSPKPNPVNYGTVTYHEPNTHVLTNAEGKVTSVRYRLDPEDGEQLYPNDPTRLEALSQSYLEEDLRNRLPERPIVFTIQAHIAGPDDVLRRRYNTVQDDDNVAKQQQIAFSPTPDSGGINGIAAIDDPLIRARKGVYRISAEQRRHEKQVE